MATEVLQTQVIQKAWEDASFREKLMADPKSAIRDVLGVVIPDHIQIKTVEETSDQFYLVIPPNPSGVLTTSQKPRSMW
ncbi:NHLP leader peptide family RiPP precursor [Paenibacillus polymyxa]|uniref:NHLP leader peptide family RiPP precursor n=1 Tax=Paenibacillus polymyxa TaxID=1406 RepID=UPI0025B69669|nr:NHLP leader peptide family RiPP precursor [Paenibacillus polymyxa]MDN4076570.1 NHLP leader peptide family RiPP precursor [Paenibacillus polymyxa]MDN4101996.1 NHLP leader peptide family RiPP precursor [Paenibacillus polymyxa]MDN4112213.1 NHLP leader peptide family RiPP precursor [Paenibacillus polymyxa]